MEYQKYTIIVRLGKDSKVSEPVEVIEKENYSLIVLSNEVEEALITGDGLYPETMIRVGKVNEDSVLLDHLDLPYDSEIYIGDSSGNKYYDPGYNYVYQTNIYDYLKTKGSK